MDQSRKALIERSDDDCNNPEQAEDDDHVSNNIVNAVNRALNGTARLNNLLPTGTLLSFQVFCPVVSNDGQCDKLHRCLTGILLGFCAISCLAFCFTDSFRAANGKIYYGLATPRGLWTFGSRKGPMDPSRYKLCLMDFVHAFLSLQVVAALGLSNVDVVNCFYPEMPKVLINTVPLVAGFVISLLFFLFPSKRRGIGYPTMLRQDSISPRYDV